MTIFSLTPLAAAGLVATAILVLMIFLTWQYRSGPVGQFALLTLGCAALYSFLFSLSLGTTDPGFGLLLMIFQMPVRLALPVLAFLFILLYIGEIEQATSRMVALTFAVPAVILAGALTTPLHTLFVTDLSFTLAGGRLVYAFTPGPLFWASHLYAAVLVIAGVSLAASRFVRSPPLYRVQIVAILLAFVVPVFMHAGLILMPDSVFSVILAIGGFALSGIALYTAMSRYRFLTLAPVAIPVLFDRLADGVIIANNQDLVVGLNPAAARILGRERGAVIGMPAGALVPAGEAPGRQCGAETGTPLTIMIPLAGRPHYYDLSAIPLCSREQVPGGTILVLHDSHERHLAGLMLLKSNEKLQLLTSITRHDMLNTLTALMGSLGLARAGPVSAETDRFLERAEEYADLLQGQIEFTRDYQTLGLHSAQWQNVKKAIELHLPGTGLPEIIIEPPLAAAAVFADPMFGQVFYNLVDNSLRHGRHVTRIRIGGYEDKGEFVIRYEDNGCGIDDGDKDRIFHKGFGKNTGLGLFLTREILALTGMQIRENGTPGQGARFEIRVSHGAYRLE